MLNTLTDTESPLGMFYSLINFVWPRRRVDAVAHLVATLFIQILAVDAEFTWDIRK